MAFSGALQLASVSDFLAPSQECVLPPSRVQPAPSNPSQPPELAVSPIQRRAPSQPPNPSTSNPPPLPPAPPTVASISLTDCLACSGCITTSEAVLVAAQSDAVVRDVLSQIRSADPSTPFKTAVLSISPQSLASLAARLLPSPLARSSTASNHLQGQITTALKSLGFSYVQDTTFSRHVALRELVREYTARPAGTPLLASACPGWVCYAEKTQPALLPLISTVKSPQQIQASLLKHLPLPSTTNTTSTLQPHEIFHVAVMPCYDKKLEASRQDFQSAQTGPDVDCVLTTAELLSLLPTPDVLLSLPPTPPTVNYPSGLQHPGSSSGSYLHTLIAHHRATHPTPLELVVHRPRPNTDYEEYTLVDQEREGQVVFRGAKCYGFRNLQNVVRKVGRTTRGGQRRRLPSSSSGSSAAPTYDYVEVMACPNGCINGGGQLAPDPDRSQLLTTASTVDEEGFERNWEESGVAWQPKSNTQWTDLVEEIYWQTEVTDNALRQADQAYETIMTTCKDPQALFRTSYHAVEQPKNGLVVQW